MTSALIPSTISEADITAALRNAGLIEPEGPGGGFNRCTMSGFMFTFDNGDVATSNPKTGSAAFRCRILDAPVEYQAAWINDKLAIAIDRPGDTGFCKSHFAVPAEARKFSDKGTACGECPIGPFVPKANIPAEAEGRKCQWKADVSFQLLDAQGEISDPTVHTLTLSTTGIIEFKGTSRETQKGSVSALNFVQQLARFGATLTPENPVAGMSHALASLPLGGVIADVRSLTATSDDKSRTWNVASFTPVAVIDVAAPTLAAIPAVAPSAPASHETDDLPF